MASFTTISVGLLVFIIFALALVAQLRYYLVYFKKLAYYKNPGGDANTPPATIIVCARNEEENLVAFLPLIFEQEYPNYEVIVVNDCSFDNTADILKEFTKKYPNLKVVTINESKNFTHGKKVAIMMGVKGATHEHLLFTDADCKPNSKLWLKNMMQHFTVETEIVLGYSAFEKQSGFLNKIIRMDNFVVAFQYLSFALAGKTYMGVGRNLAYRKSLFFKMKGFASHYHIEAGDDDLFVNEAATKYNSKIEIDLNSHTVSKVKKTFSEWMYQKHKHSETFTKYNAASRRLLIMLRFSYFILVASFITLLILQFEPIVILSLFMLRVIVQIFIFNKSMSLLGEKDLLILSPILELVLLIVNPLISLGYIFKGKNKWEKANG